FEYSESFELRASGRRPSMRSRRRRMKSGAPDGQGQGDCLRGLEYTSIYATNRIGLSHTGTNMTNRSISRLPVGLLIVIAAMPGPTSAQSGAQAARLEALAERVQMLADREEIRALIMTYGDAHDNRDYRTFSSLFAEE